MPLLWACLLLDFGYALVRIYGMLGARSNGDVGLYITMVAGGLLAAVWSACTDFWAVKAGWWAYRPGKVILGDSCALYVVIGTFFIFCAFLPILARYLSCGGSRLYAAIRYGFIFGGVIFISYIMAHLLVENRI
jgi:hypothetical protein